MSVEREVHYVLEVKIQEVVKVTTGNATSQLPPKVERHVADVAHYVVKEKTLPALVGKGVRLLELSGE